MARPRRGNLPLAYGQPGTGVHLSAAAAPLFTMVHHVTRRSRHARTRPVTTISRPCVVSPVQDAHAAAVQHHCGAPPFNLNMTQAPPEALTDPVFQNPWVQNNVAVTYDPLTTKDGLGSQIHRQLGVYAVAACTGLQYKSTAGFQRFTHLNQSDAHMLAQRVNTMLGIPSTPERVNPTWRVVHFGRDCNITWDTLLTKVKAALALQQPTLFNISFVYGFALTYPAMLNCAPASKQQVRWYAMTVALHMGYTHLPAAVQQHSRDVPDGASQQLRQYQQQLPRHCAYALQFKFILLYARRAKLCRVVAAASLWPSPIAACAGGCPYPGR